MVDEAKDFFHLGYCTPPPISEADLGEVHWVHPPVNNCMYRTCKAYHKEQRALRISVYFSRIVNPPNKYPGSATTFPETTKLLFIACLLIITGKSTDHKYYLLNSFGNNTDNSAVLGCFVRQLTHRIVDTCTFTVKVMIKVMSRLILYVFYSLLKLFYA